MKKKISAILAAVMVFAAVPAHSQKVGDVIGTVYNTDIVAYVNNYAIPSYAANGTSVIVAEDLRNFGFDVEWNGEARQLSISRNTSSQPATMTVEKTGAPSTEFADLLYTDITVYADGIKIPSYAINGYTMIPMESLTMLGECIWVSEQRALKMWVDGLHIRPEMQKVEQYIGDLRGVWSSVEYPDICEIYIYAQNGNVIDFGILAMNARATRIATAEVQKVKITDGTGTFRFEDSFGFRGTGTIRFSDGMMSISYNVTSSGAGYSIVAGEGLYTKTGTAAEANKAMPGMFW